MEKTILILDASLITVYLLNSNVLVGGYEEDYFLYCWVHQKSSTQLACTILNTQRLLLNR